MARADLLTAGGGPGTAGRAWRYATFGLAALALLTAALRRWSIQLPRLAVGEEPFAAMDLRQRYVALQHWLAGDPVYGVVDSAVYPPASYALLAPLLGPLSFGEARWLWAALSLLCTALLGALLVRAARPAHRGWAVVLFLLPWGHYAAPGGTGVGQLALPSVTALFAAFVLLTEAGTGGGNGTGWSAPQRPVSGLRQVGIGVLFALALVKPTLAVPFVWVLLVVPAGRLPVLVAAAVYGLASVAAAVPRPEGPLASLAAWWRRVGEISWQGGYGHLTNWIDPDVSGWMVLVVGGLGSLLLGGWIVLHRRADPWLLLGLTALATRLVFYHRLYDDLLLFFPVVALLRRARWLRADRSRRWAPTLAGVASGLALLAVVSGLLPTGWHQAGPPRDALFNGFQVGIRLAILLFLLLGIGRSAPAVGATAPASSTAAPATPGRTA